MKRYFPEIGKNRELTEKSCELADQVEALELSDGQKQTVDKIDGNYGRPARHAAFDHLRSRHH